MKLIDILKSLNLKPGDILYSPLLGNVMFLKFKDDKILCLDNQGENDINKCITEMYDVPESEVQDQIDAICEDSEYVVTFDADGHFIYFDPSNHINIESKESMLFPLSTESIWKFEYGEDYGELSGIFTIEDSVIKDSIGKTVEFGDVLGKHSQVNLTLEDYMFTKISDNPKDVYYFKELNMSTGCCPFDYEFMD